MEDGEGLQSQFQVQESGSPSGAVNATARDDDKSMGSSLPGSMLPGKNIALSQGRVLTTIFQEDKVDKDNWNEFTIVTGADVQVVGCCLTTNPPGMCSMTDSG